MANYLLQPDGSSTCCDCPDRVSPCDDCTPTGACCVDGVCSIQTETDCTGLGGTYQGDGTDCDPNPCPSGPCSTVSVTLAASATIFCPAFSLTILSGSTSASHTFSSFDPDPTVWDRVDQCQSFGCLTFDEGNGCSAPTTDRFGYANFSFERICESVLSVIAGAEIGCTDCEEPPCDPNHDPQYSGGYFVNDSISSADDYPGGLPMGETIITDHFEDDQTIFMLSCHRTMDLTLTIDVS